MLCQALFLVFVLLGFQPDRLTKEEFEQKAETLAREGA